MKSGLRVGSMLIGLLILSSIKFTSDFTAIGDYIAFIMGICFPMLMIILPVVFEFIERNRR